MERLGSVSNLYRFPPVTVGCHCLWRSNWNDRAMSLISRPEKEEDNKVQDSQDPKALPWGPHTCNPRTLMSTNQTRGPQAGDPGTPPQDPRTPTRFCLLRTPTPANHVPLGLPLSRWATDTPQETPARARAAVPADTSLMSRWLVPSHKSYSALSPMRWPQPLSNSPVWCGSGKRALSLGGPGFHKEDIK